MDSSPADWVALVSNVVVVVVPAVVVEGAVVVALVVSLSYFFHLSAVPMAVVAVVAVVAVSGVDQRRFSLVSAAPVALADVVIDVVADVVAAAVGAAAAAAAVVFFLIFVDCVRLVVATFPHTFVTCYV